MPTICSIESGRFTKRPEARDTFQVGIASLLHITESGFLYLNYTCLKPRKKVQVSSPNENWRAISHPITAKEEKLSGELDETRLLQFLWRARLPPSALSVVTDGS